MKGKHFAGLALIIVLLMIVGCVKQPVPVETEQKVVKEDTGKVKEIVDDMKETKEMEEKEMTDTEDETEMEKETMPPKEMDSDLKALLEKGAKHDQYIFKHAKSPYLTRINTVIVKGNKIKNILPSEDIYKKHELYTVVYLDSSDKSAVGYCEDEQKCPDLKKEFPDVTYENHYIATPVDWVKSIEYAEEVGGESLYGREAIAIEFEKNGKIHRAAIDSFYGLPLQITQNHGTRDEITETYEIIRVGTINDNEVMRQPVFD